MENFRDILESIYEFLRPILLIMLGIISTVVLLNIMFYYAIKIDESNLEKTRFCPNCGIDLIHKIEG